MNKKSKASKILIFVIMSVFLLKSGISLEFITVPYMNNYTTSEENLVCSWNASTDTISQNITWYNSSEIVTNIEDVTSPKVLEYTKRKDETWICKITITNGTETLSSNISVIIKNSLPKNLVLYNSSNNLVNGNITNITEDIFYQFYLNSTDYDGDLLEYSIDYKPDDVTFTILGLFSWTPLQASVGENNVIFWVTDKNMPITKVGLAFLFNVTEVNDAPVFSPALSDKNATEDIYFEYTISATDEEDNFPLIFEILDNDGLDILTIQSLSDTSAKLNFTPDFEDAGNYTITIRVNDSNNASTQAQFDLEVIPTNHAPNITYLENVSAEQGQSFLLHLNASDMDADDNITFSITSAASGCSGLWSIEQLNFSANNSYGIINVTALTNNHIICRGVLIRMTDNHGAYTESAVTLSINNTNDAPIIYENSSYSANTLNNINIYNLTAYQYSGFRYRLNFTDVDNLTYEGDTVLISTNFTNFTITLNSATGEINFTANNTGNYEIYINATDASDLNDYKILNLTIIPNSLPVIQIIPNFTINESELFNYTINASDDEDGANIHYYTNASSEFFTINSATGNILFTPTQSQILNYSITIWVNDSVGATTYAYFNINIINKNDAPVLSSFSDFNDTLIIANHAFYYDFDATDPDFSLPLEYAYDNLTFWTNSTVFTINPLTGVIYFTPEESDAGNYSVLIGVNDTQNASNTSILTFRIYNTSYPPQITSITPYGPPPTNLGWTNPSNFPSGYTTINVSENSSVTFNHTTINTDSDETISYSWYVNGVKNSSDYSYTHYFNFFSSGEAFNITFVVNDSHYSESRFSWIVNVTNVNRPVLFFNNPINLTGGNSVTGTYIIDNFIIFSYPNGTFYDPDDDTDSDGTLDGDETSSLNFSYTFISGLLDSVSILIEDTKGTFTPLKTGQAVYTFTASDGETNATSGNVHFNMTLSSSQNTGSSSSTRTITRTRTENVYYQVEIEKPVTIDVLAPTSATMYENNTIIIPVTLKNTGNSTIFGVSLSAFTNNSEVEMSFEKDYFQQLFTNIEENTNLIVKSYRNQGRYEIEIKAEAQNPSFSDTAVVLISSIEKEEGDASSKITAKTMISHAKDLLSTNMKCLELNEQLKDVEKDIEGKKYSVAQQKIDEIIKTCKYLTSEKEFSIEKPNIVYVSMKKIRNNPTLLYTLFAMMTALVFGVGYSIYYTNKKV